MKKSLIFFALILVVLSGCSGYSHEEVVNLTENAYERGYNDGLTDSDFLLPEHEDEDISVLINDAIFECELTAASEGLHPEEALSVFEEYLNGEYISKEELWTALDSLTVYYYQSLRIDDYVEKHK